MAERNEQVFFDEFTGIRIDNVAVWPPSQPE